MRSAIVAFTVLLATPLVLSCGTSGKYNTMKKGQLHSDMWKLVMLVDSLDVALKNETTEPSNKDVVGLLSQMDDIANRLGSKDRKRHPLIEDNIDEFRSDIVKALRAARRNPPNYYYSGKVTGACILCHDPKGGIR